jgi:hypothetical protein
MSVTKTGIARMESGAGSSFDLRFKFHQRLKAEFCLQDLYDEMEKNFASTVEMELDPLDMKRLNHYFNTAEALHVHEGSDDNPYVCYPEKIKDLNEATKVMSLWFAVTLFQAKTRIDPNTLQHLGQWLQGVGVLDENVDPFFILEDYVKDTFDWTITIQLD